MCLERVRLQLCNQPAFLNTPGVFQPRAVHPLGLFEAEASIRINVELAHFPSLTNRHLARLLHPLTAEQFRLLQDRLHRLFLQVRWVAVAI